MAGAGDADYGHIYNVNQNGWYILAMITNIKYIKNPMSQ
jgi:hypothetical protein